MQASDLLSIGTLATDVGMSKSGVFAHFGSREDLQLAVLESAARRFMAAIDSAIVMHNASTQFADGGEFGMGAEIGIATGKMHARGPVGLEQLCSFKYLVHGSGQIRG